MTAGVMDQEASKKLGPEGFVAYVRKICQTKKTQSDLRRGLGLPVERCSQAHRYLVPVMGHARLHRESERAHYAIAALIAARPRVARDADAAVAAEVNPGGAATEALRSPHWAPYLGRRSCVPDEPLLLRVGVSDPKAELREGVPLSARDRGAPRGSAEPGSVLVEFYWEHGEGGSSALSMVDVPTSFGPYERGYRKRAVYKSVEQLPIELRESEKELGERLVDYVLEGEEGAGGHA